MQVVGFDMAGVRARDAAGLHVDTPAIDFDNHNTFAIFRGSVQNGFFLTLNVFGEEVKLGFSVEAGAGGSLALRGRTAQ